MSREKEKKEKDKEEGFSRIEFTLPRKVSPEGLPTCFYEATPQGTPRELAVGLELFVMGNSTAKSALYHRARCSAISQQNPRHLTVSITEGKELGENGRTTITWVSSTQITPGYHFGPLDSFRQLWESDRAALHFKLAPEKSTVAQNYFEIS